MRRVDGSLFSWKTVGSVTGTSNAITFPATARELYIDISWNNSLNYRYTLYLQMESLNSNANMYISFGGYHDSTSENGGWIRVTKSTRQIWLAGLTYKGNDVSSTGVMRVQYR